MAEWISIPRQLAKVKKARGLERGVSSSHPQSPSFSTYRTANNIALSVLQTNDSAFEIVIGHNWLTWEDFRCCIEPSCTADETYLEASALWGEEVTVVGTLSERLHTRKDKASKIIWYCGIVEASLCRCLLDKWWSVRLLNHKVQYTTSPYLIYISVSSVIRPENNVELPVPQTSKSIIRKVEKLDCTRIVKHSCGNSTTLSPTKVKTAISTSPILQ